MANATTRDARAGFDLYRSAGSAISLDELNQQLVSAGYGPVSQRMIDHYRKLVAAGFDRYISINRFDIARAASPYGDQLSSPRHSARTLDEGVLLVFAKHNKLYEAAATAAEVSEAGAVFRVLDAEGTAGLKATKISLGGMVSARFLESGTTRTGRVVDLDLESAPGFIELEYTQLLSLAEIGAGALLPLTKVTYQLTGEPDERLTPEIVGQRLYEFFEILEEVRALVNATADPSPDRPSYAPPIELESLRVASPAVIAVSVAEQVRDAWPVSLGTLLLGSIATVVHLRKTWYEGTSAKLANEESRKANREKGPDISSGSASGRPSEEDDAQASQAATKDADVAALEKEIKRKSGLADSFGGAIAESLRSSFPNAVVDEVKVKFVVEARIVPALERLAEVGITDISVVEGEQ
jgi:hypothetical protein